MTVVLSLQPLLLVGEKKFLMDNTIKNQPRMSKSYRSQRKVKQQIQEWEYRISVGSGISNDNMEKLVLDGEDSCESIQHVFKTIKAMIKEQQKQDHAGLNEIVNLELKREIEELKLSLSLKEEIINSIVQENTTLRGILERMQKEENFSERKIASLEKKLAEVERKTALLEAEYNKKSFNSNERRQMSRKDKSRNSARHDGTKILNEQLIQVPSKTEVYDKKIRGGIQNDASAEESLKCFFNGGLYSKILEDMDDWCVADLGRLLVGTTRLMYRSLRDCSLGGIRHLLLELFQYQPKVLDSKDEEDRMMYISNAYGLLISYFTDTYWKRHESKFIELIKEDRIYCDLYERVSTSRHQRLFTEFQKELAEQIKKMFAMSPPMIIHKPQEFVKNMIQRIPRTSEKSPLLWTQPVVMNNYYGQVCVKGRAGNMDEAQKVYP